MRRRSNPRPLPQRGRGEKAKTIKRRGSASGKQWPLDSAWSERARDAAIGALCRLLGVLCGPLTRPPRGGWTAPRRLLVLKPCCMGDVLFTTPLLAAIKAAYPASHITLATSAWSATIVAENAAVDTLLAVPSRIGLRDLRMWAGRLRAEHFDCALVPDRSPLLGVLVALAGIPRRVGLDSGGRGFLYTGRVAIPPDDQVLHEADLYGRVGAAIGALPLPGQGTVYHPPADALTRAAALIAERGWQPPVWAIHPGGGVNPGMTLTPKRWSPERFAALADGLLEAYGGTVLLLGAESDADALRAVQQAMHHPSVTLVGTLDFPMMQAVAHHAALYIGNDSGTTHCALAGGTPTICIFGPTDARQYGLYGGRGMMVVGRVPWSPCFRRGRLSCTCGTIRCMDCVTVEAVRAAADQLVGATL
ncbi:MAG: glycosyltransferase family 9 protein [Thermomicrobia bacterium]|nr:glycosyltransferase family 9 protein [Thermomicrobia bacterium]MCA1722739.1 glycosyltransferase family 9 protein [Thermomicrobia bacterium]